MDQVSFRQGRWNLADLLPEHSGPAFQQLKDDFLARVAHFEKRRAQLSEDIAERDLMRILRAYDDLSITAHKLGAFAELWFSENTQNTEALAFRRQVEQLLTEVGNRTLFFSLWWKSLSDPVADRLMQNTRDYRYWLESMRLFKPHTLAEREEQIINLKDVNGINGLVTLYEMITTRFQFRLRVNGKERTLSREELAVYFRDPDPKVRAAAYQELYRVYAEHGNELAQIYAYRAQDWRSEQLDLRHYKSPLAARNLANDVPDEATEALLDVCREKAGIFQSYFRQKARYLGLKKLRRYDIYAPLAPSDKTYQYPEAVAMVLDSFKAFSPRVLKAAQSIFEANHIDSELRPGKTHGAFCAGVVPTIPPYVLLNFTGRARDVSTMAHELGHAVHYVLASKHSALTVHSVLPLAETASVFSEMILTDRLLKQEQDPNVRRDILATKLDDTYATVMRQAFFVLFEREAHELITQGKPVEDLCALYLQNLHDQFGDAVDIGDEFKWEWISVPHFYNVPFYVYAYSFGQLLSLALYQQYRAQGKEFIPRYLKILAYGGSEKPDRILKEAGIDMTSRDFWRGGFELVHEWSAALEELPAPELKPAREKRGPKQIARRNGKKASRDRRGAKKKTLVRRR